MRTYRIAGLIFALAAMASAQVGTVQNAAVYQTPGLLSLPGFVVPNNYVNPLLGYTAYGPNTNIVSPRMLAVLSYPVVEAIAIIGPTVPPPTPVNATLSIRPVGSSTPIPVTVTNAVAGAITFVVPAGVPLGGAELLYQIDNQPTQWTNVNVVQSSFAFFLIGPNGPAIAQTVAPNGSLRNIGLTTPVQPGQTLHLSGSGLGYGSTVSATIGGVAATVDYAGADPTQAGRDEILIPIPPAVPDGCYVPVALTYNQTTVTTTISKTSDGSPCRHPWQLSVNDMKTLDNGGSLADGVVALNTTLRAATTAAASRNESANMSLSQLTASGIAAYFAPAPAASSPSCTALAPAIAVPLLLNGSFSVLGQGPPDLGASVTLQNPAAPITLAVGTNGYSYANLPPATDGPLTNLPPSAIPGGKWTWQSSGGKDLPASSFSFTLPAPIQLNGGAPISIRRDQDQTISWNGAAFDAGATVNIYLNGNTQPQISCTVPATAGTVTMPAALLAAYSPNTIGTLTANLTESGSFVPHAQFALQNGNTLLMLVSYFTLDSRPVVFQ
jgi:uncharacterized protein (TIGR03437 family)